MEGNVIKCTRLALSGSHYGGKTTLALALARRLGFESITYSRPTTVAVRMGYRNAGEIPPHKMQQFKWLVLSEQMRAEQAVMDRMDLGVSLGFVADRDVICMVGYWQVCVPDELKHPGYPEIARSWAEHYDAIVVVPPLPSCPEENGMRLVNDPWPVHRATVKALGELGLVHKVIMVLSDGPEQREVEVIRKLKERGFDVS